MTAPPAKRQKRLVVLSSSPERDGDEDSKEGVGSRDRPGKLQERQELSVRTRARPRRETTTPAEAEKVSPRKLRARTKPTRKAMTNRSIANFLTASIERSKWAQADVTNLEELEDVIQDELSGVDTAKAVATDAARGARARRRKEDDAADCSAGGSQKFLSDNNRSRQSTREPSTASARPSRFEDHRPWVDRYAPAMLDEIAVHPKKVEDVRQWILDTFADRNQKRLLVLRGASGTGKSTTVTLLAKSLDFEILEWRNPVAAESSTVGYVSVLAQFLDFLERGARFGGLDLVTLADGAREAKGSAPTSRNKIILMEEFPNTFTSSLDSLYSFRSIVLQFLHSPNASTGQGLSGAGDPPPPTVPMIMVVSETVLASSSSSDQFTAHRLLGPNLLNHPAVSVIDFNPIARTLLTKALQSVMQKEARISGRRTMPGMSVLERIGEIGDIRSAVGALEFMCLRGDGANDWGGKVALSKPKRNARNAVPMTKLEKESLEVITQREASLGMFHAVGKVVYNKRDETAHLDVDVPPVPQPPAHLGRHARPKRSPLGVEELMDQTGTDIQTFVCTLHENYLPSCYGSTTGDSLDTINGCIDALSDCDLLTPDSVGNQSSKNSRGGSRRAGFSFSGRDGLRQDEMSFQTAVRGLLFALPTPVRRQLPSAQGQHPRGRYAGRSGARDAFKMFYPVSLKLWRQCEELEGVLEAWLESSGTGMLSNHPISASESGVIESWTRKTSNNPVDPKMNPASGGQARGLVMLGTEYLARSELILETLPYLAKILRSKPWAEPVRLDELEKITVLRGLNIQDADSFEDEDEAERGLGPVTQQPSHRSRGGDFLHQVGAIGASSDQGNATWVSAQAASTGAKLTLSDDEIEDDEPD